MAERISQLKGSQKSSLTHRSDEGGHDESLDFLVESLMGTELDRSTYDAALSQQMNEIETCSDHIALDQIVDKLTDNMVNESSSFGVLLKAAQQSSAKHKTTELATCENKTSTTKKAGENIKQLSFSLFDMLDQQQPLQEIVTLESIFECYRSNSALKVIDMIERIESIEDIADPTHWAEFNNILFQGLKPVLVDQFLIKESNTSLESQIRYTNIHWKIFAACTPDHVSLRKDLFLNLVQAVMDFYQHCFIIIPYNNVRESFSLSDDKSNLLVNLLSHQIATLMKMIIPIASSIQFLPNEEVDELFILTFSLLKNIIPGGSKLHVVEETDKKHHFHISLIPAHLIALLDPFADWFYIWVKQISPIQLNQILLHAEFIDDIVWRCSFRSSFPYCLSNLSGVEDDKVRHNSGQGLFQMIQLHLDASLSHIDSLDNQWSIRVMDLNESMFLQSLSMLRSILVMAQRSFPFSHVGVLMQNSAVPYILPSNLPCRDQIPKAHASSIPTLYNGRLRLYTTPNEASGMKLLDNESWGAIVFITDPFLNVLRVGVQSPERNVPDTFLNICEQALDTIANICSSDSNVSEKLFRHVTENILPVLSLQSQFTSKDDCDLSFYAVGIFLSICRRLSRKRIWDKVTSEMSYNMESITDSYDVSRNAVKNMLETSIQLICSMTAVLNRSAKDNQSTFQNNSPTDSKEYFASLCTFISLLHPFYSHKYLIKEFSSERILSMVLNFHKVCEDNEYGIEASFALSSFSLSMGQSIHSSNEESIVDQLVPKYALMHLLETKIDDASYFDQQFYLIREACGRRKGFLHLINSKVFYLICIKIRCLVSKQATSMCINSVEWKVLFTVLKAALWSPYAFLALDNKTRNKEYHDVIRLVSEYSSKTKDSALKHTLLDLLHISSSNFDVSLFLTNQCSWKKIAETIKSLHNQDGSNRKFCNFSHDNDKKDIPISPSFMGVNNQKSCSHLKHFVEWYQMSTHVDTEQVINSFLFLIHQDNFDTIDLMPSFPSQVPIFYQTSNHSVPNGLAKSASEVDELKSCKFDFIQLYFKDYTFFSRTSVSDKKELKEMLVLCSPSGTISIDWYSVCMFALCSGNISQFRQFMAVLSQKAGANIIWPYAKNYFALKPNILRESIVVKVVMEILETECPEILVSLLQCGCPLSPFITLWMRQAFIGTLNFNEVLILHGMVLSLGIDFMAYFIVAIIHHSQSFIIASSAEFTKHSRLYDALLCNLSLSDFRIVDYLELANSLRVRHRVRFYNILKECTLQEF